jgi:hypothetical protein
MTKRRNADLFEVLIGQIGQDDKIDVILSKALSVLPRPSRSSQSAVCCIADLRPAAAFGTMSGFSFNDSLGCALADLPPALERLFIGSLR